MASRKITADLLIRIGARDDDARRATALPGRALGCWALYAEIDTPLRQAHFLGQLFHESGALRVTEENLNYSAEALRRVWPSRFTPELAARAHRNPETIANIAYGGRMGNARPGDGWRYRGRGYPQLTGYNNYSSFAAFLNDDEPIVNPDSVADKYAAAAAAHFWQKGNINRYADEDDILRVSRAVNGWVTTPNGMPDRVKWTQRAKAALGVRQ